MGSQRGVARAVCEGRGPRWCVSVLQVPEHVHSVSVKMWGSGGGQGHSKQPGFDTGSGGAGGFVSAAIPVTPGATYTIVVGDGGKEGSENQYNNGRLMVTAHRPRPTLALTPRSFTPLPPRTLGTPRQPPERPYPPPHQPLNRHRWPVNRHQPPLAIGQPQCCRLTPDDIVVLAVPSYCTR